MKSNSELQKIIGENIRKRRKSARLSQEKLGELVSYSKAAIHRYETGDRSLSLVAAFSLADQLNCSVEDFRPQN